MSQPGRNLSLIRGKPSATAGPIAASSSSVESITPKSAPTAHFVSRFAAGGFAQQHVQRLAGGCGGEAPPGAVEGRLGEVVSLEMREAVLQIVAAGQVLSDECRREPLPSGGENPARPFRAVARRGQRRGLAPARQRAARHPAEHAFDRRVLAIGGPPRIDERHRDVIQLDAIDVHGEPGGVLECCHDFRTPSIIAERRPVTTRQSLRAEPRGEPFNTQQRQQRGCRSSSLWGASGMGRSTRPVAVDWTDASRSRIWCVSVVKDAV